MDVPVKQNHYSIAVRLLHLSLKCIPQLDPRQSFDASSPARLHWPSQVQLIAVSSSSDSYVCGNYMLAGERILVHKYKFETKLTLENSLSVYSVMQLFGKGITRPAP